MFVLSIIIIIIISITKKKYSFTGHIVAPKQLLQNMKSLLFLILHVALQSLFVATVDATPSNVAVTLSIEELVKIRCSKNPYAETYFFFNGTVTAYVGIDTGPSYTPTSSIVPLFDAVGINVARCYQAQNGYWYLVGREAMWYLDRTTHAILSTWQWPTLLLPQTVVDVVHVDNDPVIQSFPPGIPLPAQVRHLSFIGLSIRLFEPLFFSRILFFSPSLLSFISLLFISLFPIGYLSK